MGAVFEVGKPFPARRPWYDGFCAVEVQAGGVMLQVAYDSPTASEVRAFRRGMAEFAVAAFERHLVWVWRFTDPQRAGQRPRWSDAPWEYHRQPTAAPPGVPGTSFPLHVVLVDARTGIVVAQRLIGPPVEFCDTVRELVEAQGKVPYQKDVADAAREAVYRRYPQSEGLLPLAVCRFESIRDDA